MKERITTDKQAIFNHFSLILDNILDSSLFMNFYLQNPYILDENIYGENDSDFPDNLDLCTGATRGCLVDKDYDYVVKFDLVEAYDSMCEREEQIYKLARQQHLDQYLCETGYVDTYTKTITFYDSDVVSEEMEWYGCNSDNFDEEFEAHSDKFGLPIQIEISIPLYAARRAKPCQCGKVSVEEKRIVCHHESPLSGRSLAVAALFIRAYGEEEYARFSEFAIENEINDLHSDNVGTVCGNFVLIDFAGFHDSY